MGWTVNQFAFAMMAIPVLTVQLLALAAHHAPTMGFAMQMVALPSVSARVALLEKPAARCVLRSAMVAVHVI